MQPAPPPPATVERFAEIVAHLSAPFALREAVLREAGLDERAWSQLEQHWTAQLAADAALVDRYVARYAAVITPTEPAAKEAPLGAEAAVVVATAAAAPLTFAVAALPEPPSLVAMPPPGLRVDGTLDPQDGAAFRAALPFLRGRPMTRIAAPGPVKPAADPGRPDATLELGASLPIPALAPPGKRLHRFDAKTGAALPVPLWIDDGVDPKKPA